MTANEMATEFVRTMNPEMVTDGRANFGIYEFPLPQENVHLEVLFIEEDFVDEPKFRTLIEVVGKDSCSTGVYTFAETMTDVDAIASAIQYVLDEIEK